MSTPYDQTVRHARKKPLWMPGPATHDVTFGRETVERLVRHREPFLFVDAIDAVDFEQKAIAGRRRIDPADPIFVGHFPGAPIYPGVLQLETMGQMGLCLLHFAQRNSLSLDDAPPRDVRALKIHHAQFLTEVGPGAQLDVRAHLIEGDDYTAICAGQIMQGDSVASLAIMEVYFVE